MVFGLGFMKMTDLLPLRWVWFMLVPVYVVGLILAEEWLAKRGFGKIDSLGT